MLTQRERDDLADCVTALAEITEPFLSDIEIADFLKPYIGEAEYQWLMGEIAANHDWMDAFR